MVAICSLLDRTLLSFVLVPLQGEFGVSDFALGLLAGPAFAIAYLAASFPIGFGVDKFSRRAIIIQAVLLWTLAAIGCALSPTFLILIVMRAIVGAGEAAFTPVVNSMAADFFSPRQRPVAIAICMSAGTLGISMAFLFGSAIVTWLMNSPTLHWPFVGELSTWRATLLIGAAFGVILLPLLVFFLREPVRSELATGKTEQAGAGAFIARHGVGISAIAVGQALMGMGPYSFLSWLPVFYLRTFDWSAAQSGFVFAVTGGIAAFIGSFALGFLPGLLARFRVRTPEFASGLFAGVLANGFGAAAMLAPNPVTATVFLTLAFLTMTAPYIFGLSMINVAVPAQFRGRVTALFMIAIGLITNAGGAAAVGFLSEHVFADQSKLNLALFTVWITALAVGAIVMIAGRPAYERMVADARQQLEDAASRGA
jgi:MFS family permease